MGDVPRTAIMDAALGAVSVGVQAWGVTQEQRRAAEYQKAVASAREGFRVAMDDIQREMNPHKHQKMFEQASTNIRASVGKEWLRDPWVRNQFDRMWPGMAQSARETAMGYSRQLELQQIQTEMFNEIEDLARTSGIKTGAGMVRDIIESQHEAGNLDHAQRQKAYDLWRNTATAALARRAEKAVEQRDPETINRLFDEALETGLIRDPTVAMQARNAAMYEIRLHDVHDLAVAVYHEQGINSAINFLNNPDAMEGVKWQDRARIRSDVRDTISMMEAERVREERIRYDAMLEKVNELETEMLNGREGWNVGLEWIDQEKVREALGRDKQQQIRREWEQRLAWSLRDEEEGAGPLIDKAAANQFWSQTMQDVRRGDRSQIEIEDDIYNAVNTFVIDVPMANQLLEANRDRPKLSERENYFTALINDVANTYADEHKRDVPQAERQRLIDELFLASRNLSYDPDGKPRTEQQREMLLRAFINNRLNDRDSYETGALWWRRAVTDNEVVRRADSWDNIGRIPQNFHGAVTAVLDGVNMDDDELGKLALNLPEGTPLHLLHGSERNAFNAAIDLARVGNRHYEQFLTDFNLPPDEVAWAVDVTGLLRFGIVELDPQYITPDNPDGMVTRWYRKRSVGNDVVWSHFVPSSDGDGAWRKGGPERRPSEDEQDRADTLPPRDFGQYVEAMETVKGTPYEKAFTAAIGNDVKEYDLLTLAEPMTAMMDTIRSQAMRRTRLLNDEETALFYRIHQILVGPAVLSATDFDKAVEFLQRFGHLDAESEVGSEARPR